MSVDMDLVAENARLRAQVEQLRRKLDVKPGDDGEAYGPGASDTPLGDLDSEYEDAKKAPSRPASAAKSATSKGRPPAPKKKPRRKKKGGRKKPREPKRGRSKGRAPAAAAELGLGNSLRSPSPESFAEFGYTASQVSSVLPPSSAPPNAGRGPEIDESTYNEDRHEVVFEAGSRSVWTPPSPEPGAHPTSAPAVVAKPPPHEDLWSEHSRSPSPVPEELEPRRRRPPRRKRPQSGSGFSRITPTTATDALLQKSRALLAEARSLKVPLSRSRHARVLRRYETEGAVRQHSTLDSSPEGDAEEGDGVDVGAGLLSPYDGMKKPRSAAEVRDDVDDGGRVVEGGGFAPSGTEGHAAAATGASSADDGYTSEEGGEVDAEDLLGAAGSGVEVARAARRRRRRRSRKRRTDGGTVTDGKSSLPVAPTPHHLFENVPVAIHIQHQQLGDGEWENEVARNILALYRADVASKAGSLAPMAAHLAFTNAEAGSPGSPKPATPPTLPDVDLATEAGTVRPPSPTKAKRPTSATAGSQLGKPATRTNRKGEPLPTISGGAGGAKGVARLRGGPFPIWFAGGGAPVTGRAVWCGLASRPVEGLPPELTEAEVMAALKDGQCVHSICNRLGFLERSGHYDKYVDVLRQLLYPLIRSPYRTEIDERQWRQLVVTCHVFAVKFVEEKKFGKALAMLQLAEQLVQLDEDMAPVVRKELHGFIMDSYSMYYLRRNRLQASLQASQKALKAHASLKQYDHVAKVTLHTAMILSKQRHHGEAIRCCGQVLQLVDEGKLEAGGSSAQKLCMIAVCFHNIAVDHLLLMQPQEACVASQNARRLARLSLSYSNRYMRHFETTHGAALDALARSREVREATKDKQSRKMFKNLSADLFA